MRALRSAALRLVSGSTATGPGRSVKKLLLIALPIVVVLAGTAYAVVWYGEQTETKVVTGSSTVEFSFDEPPGEEPRPQKEVERVPWPRYGYDVARTKFAPEFDHRPPFRTIWNRQTKQYIEFPPAVADGRVFVANQRGVFLALDAKTGKTIWRKNYRRCVASGPAVDRGTVYLSVMNPLPCARSNRTAQPGFVVALNAKTGREVWRFSRGVFESSPLIIGSYLWVGSWDHRVYALHARNGRVRWSYETGEEINSSAAFDGGTIFIGGDDGHLFALNAWTGDLVWRASSFSRFGRREHFYATPAVAYGRVYIGNSDGTLYAYGAKSGRLLWASPAGTYVYTSPAVWQKRVYVGSYDGNFSAFDAATGALVWRWEAPGAIHGAPTVMAGLVYFASLSSTVAPRAKRYVKRGKRGVYALDARTGKLVWQWRGMGQYAPIVADEERVYLVGSTRVLGLEPKRRPKAKAASGKTTEMGRAQKDRAKKRKKRG